MGHDNPSTRSESNRVSRRAVLTTVAGTPTLTYLGSVVSASDNSTEIPYIKYGDEVVKWKTVPKQWWEAEQQAVAAMKDLAAKYESHPAVTGVSLTNSEMRVNGRPTSRVEIDIGYEHSAESFTAPETDYAVPVGVRQRGPLELHSPSTSCNDNWCDTTQYNKPRGGARLDGSHSATCRVEYDDRHHLMCAAHAVTDCGAVTPSNKVHHEGGYIGEVVDHDSKEDWAIIENDPDGDFQNISGYIAGHNIRVSGHVSEEALNDMRSNGEEAYHRGAKTCTTQGPVKRTGIDLPYSSDCEGSGIYVEIDNCTYGGDSGGPHYDIWEDSGGCEWAAIVAPHKGGAGGGSGYSVGAAAHEIVDNNPIRFPSPNPCGPTQ